MKKGFLLTAAMACVLALAACGADTTDAASENLVYGTATLTYAEFFSGDVSSTELMCWAICSWVCCSKSTSRMTSYSSSVSRIGSVFSPPRWGKMSRLVVRHKSDGTVAVLAWTLFSFCFQYIPNYSTLYRKKQYFFKSCYNFCPHIDAG